MYTYNAQSRNLEQKIGQMIMVGFKGSTVDDLEVQTIAQQIHAGSIGGLIFFKYNIKSPDQIRKLTRYFKDQAAGQSPLLLAIDQEGGAVQRLCTHNGFQNYMSAYDLASNYNSIAAELYYEEMADTIAENGFNVNFGPVVDLHKEFPAGQACSIISGLNRSYSDEPETVVEYASMFVDAHKNCNVITALKHFPGHGFATQDSHQGMVDITNTHENIELKPFQEMIESGRAPMVMTAHLINKNWDTHDPATLSSSILKDKLRGDMHYNGVIVSDDLHMGAIGQHYTLEETVIKAIDAVCDILLFSNNPAAAQNVADSKMSIDIATQVISIVKNAIDQGKLNEQQIDDSYRRILKLKQEFFTEN